MTEIKREFQVSAGIRSALGFNDETPDKIVLTEWAKRTKHVCKPCWELKYCPYGPLVEQFPLYSTRQQKEEWIAEVKRDIDLGKFDEKALKVIEHELAHSDKQVDKETALKTLKGSILSEIKDYHPEDYPKKEDLTQKCQIFGHYCPVFFVNEPFTETSDLRNISRYVPRDTLIRVVRRDNQFCQKCGKPVREDEIHIDHKIPFSRGGPTEEANLRVLCEKCNKKKLASLEDVY
jgi:hypothetical protein